MNSQLENYFIYKSEIEWKFVQSENKNLEKMIKNRKNYKTYFLRGSGGAFCVYSVSFIVMPEHVRYSPYDIKK